MNIIKAGLESVSYLMLEPSLPPTDRHHGLVLDCLHHLLPRSGGRQALHSASQLPELAEGHALPEVLTWAQ